MATRIYCPVAREGTLIVLLFRAAVANIIPNELIVPIFRPLPLLLARKYTTVQYVSTITYNHEPFIQMVKLWPNDLPHPECAILWFRVTFESRYFNRQLREWQETSMDAIFREVRSQRSRASWTDHWRIITYSEFDVHVGHSFYLSLLIPGHVTHKRDRIIHEKVLSKFIQALGASRYIDFFY